LIACSKNYQFLQSISKFSPNILASIIDKPQSNLPFNQLISHSHDDLNLRGFFIMIFFSQSNKIKAEKQTEK
jgi:hypothetical protein